jgi:ferredoxin
MTEPRGLTIAIDRILCDGHGMCAELLPEMIELDDWGYPIVAATRVPEELLEYARRAVEVCPVLAFRLRAATVAPATATQVRPVGVRAAGG